VVSRAEFFVDHIDRSAWVAAIIATVAAIMMFIGCKRLKQRMDDKYAAEQKDQEDREKGIHKGI
jgi:H+/gluconate symporter-like permease